jgi:hypothetical protein
LVHMETVHKDLPVVAVELEKRITKVRIMTT